MQFQFFSTTWLLAAALSHTSLALPRSTQRLTFTGYSNETVCKANDLYHPGPPQSCSTNATTLYISNFGGSLRNKNETLSPAMAQDCKKLLADARDLYEGGFYAKAAELAALPAKITGKHILMTHGNCAFSIELGGHEQHWFAIGRKDIAALLSEAIAKSGQYFAASGTVPCTGTESGSVASMNLDWKISGSDWMRVGNDTNDLCCDDMCNA